MRQRSTVAEAATPFCAVVGQFGLRSALLLVAVDPTIGGVLIRGEPGTGKSTSVRSLQSLLPPLDVVEGCDFNCDPAEPARWCDACAERQAEIGQLPVAQRPVPIVTLPLGATEDRLLGTLDLDSALNEGRRRLAPGIMAEVNRGFLYVDEVNLAADHLMDAMLDAASSGVHHIERDGVSVTHPARFALIGTMNPGEGGLRPQILDRFGLSIEAEAILDPLLRTRVLARHLELERSPDRLQHYRSLDRGLAERVVKARAALPDVVVPDRLIGEIAGVTARLGISSHRADLVILWAAIASAALAQRWEVTVQDVALAASLALPHRTDDHVDVPAEIAAHLFPGEEAFSVEDFMQTNGRLWLLSDDDEEDPPSGGDDGARSDPPGGGSRSGGSRFGPGDSAAPHPVAVELAAGDGDLGVRLNFSAQQAAGPDVLLTGLRRASTALMIRGIGHTGGAPSRTLRTRLGSVAFVPTIVAATVGRLVGDAQQSLRVQPADVVRTVRTGRPAIGLIIVLDASWSMAMDGTFARARALSGAILRATRRGDRVALVIASGRSAYVAAPFRRQSAPVAEFVSSLRPRGRTPLLDGVELALSLCADRWSYAGCAMPVVLVVTDGRDNLRESADSESGRIATLSAVARRRRVPGAILALRGGGETRFVRLVAERLGWQIRDLAGEVA